MALILASSSPQRKKILERMGLEFKVVPANIDEHHAGLKKMHAIARSIAIRKAEAVSERHHADWIIGSDTMVLLSNGRIALKPEGRDDARKTLKTYQGSFCDVYSGLALINKAKEACYSGFERTRIHFRDFSDESLEEYLDSNEWVGRSGAMTIEGKGHWTTYMEGEYWNVVGLPVDLLKNYLKKAQLV